MARNMGQAAGQAVAETAAGQQHRIGTANGHGLDLDQNLPVAADRFWNLLHAELARPPHYQRFHVYSSLFCTAL